MADTSGPLYSQAFLTNIVRGNPDWNRFAGGPKGVNEFYGAFESPVHNDMHAVFLAPGKAPRAQPLDELPVGGVRAGERLAVAE